MPRKSSRSSEVKSNEDWRTKIHFVDFSVEEEDTIKLWYEANSPQWQDCFEQMVDSGWAVKISPPAKGDDWYATAQCRDDKVAYSGHSFTVRYPDYTMAIVLLFYVTDAMLPNGHLDLVIEPKGRAWLK